MPSQTDLLQWDELALGGVRMLIEHTEHTVNDVLPEAHRLYDAALDDLRKVRLTGNSIVQALLRDSAQRQALEAADLCYQRRAQPSRRVTVRMETIDEFVTENYARYDPYHSRGYFNGD